MHLAGARARPKLWPLHCTAPSLPSPRRRRHWTRDLRCRLPKPSAAVGTHRSHLPNLHHLRPPPHALPEFISTTMATFIPVKFTEFCQPDATMPFGKELVQITNDLRIALPTIIGKPTSSYPEDSRYRIEVHVPGRTFEPRTEPVDFKFIAPNWILGRDMAVHCALGRIKE
ncbi:hypothetical protein D1007_22876 [Hordeum vulgare]|nr:hypothetical protein D1007_22876 [Hordeum vulgare]